MANTRPPEKWGLTESADWWSAGQARRQQIYGAATEMLLEVASAQPGSRVLDVAAGTRDCRRGGFSSVRAVELHDRDLRNGGRRRHAEDMKSPGDSHGQSH